MSNGGKKMRYDNNELSIIKGTFSENEELIFALRSHLLGDKVETNIISKMSDESIEILIKTLYPEISSETGLHHNVDLYSGVAVRESGENSLMEILSRDIMSDYIFERLSSIKTKKFKENKTLKNLLDRKVEDKERCVNLLARNTIVSHIDFQLQQLVFLAGKKDETPEETIARLQKNSSK